MEDFVLTSYSTRIHDARRLMDNLNTIAEYLWPDGGKVMRESMVVREGAVVSDFLVDAESLTSISAIAITLLGIEPKEPDYEQLTLEL